MVGGEHRRNAGLLNRTGESAGSSWKTICATCKIERSKEAQSGGGRRRGGDGREGREGEGLEGGGGIGEGKQEYGVCARARGSRGVL
jgi:hypothetical protein